MTIKLVFLSSFVLVATNLAGKAFDGKIPVGPPGVKVKLTTTVTGECTATNKQGYSVGAESVAPKVYTVIICAKDGTVGSKDYPEASNEDLNALNADCFNELKGKMNGDPGFPPFELVPTENPKLPITYNMDQLTEHEIEVLGPCLM